MKNKIFDWMHHNFLVAILLCYEVGAFFPTIGIGIIGGEGDALKLSIPFLIPFPRCFMATTLEEKRFFDLKKMTKKCYHANLRGGVLEDFFKIFFKGKSLSVFGSGGMEGGVHYSFCLFFSKIMACCIIL
jgi:hypothetical protein